MDISLLLIEIYLFVIEISLFCTNRDISITGINANFVRHKKMLNGYSKRRAPASEFLFTPQRRGFFPAVTVQISGLNRDYTSSVMWLVNWDFCFERHHSWPTDSIVVVSFQACTFTRTTKNPSLWCKKYPRAIEQAGLSSPATTCRPTSNWETSITAG